MTTYDESTLAKFPPHASAAPSRVGWKRRRLRRAPGTELDELVARAEADVALRRGRCSPT